MSTVETFDDNNNNKNINHTQITPTELSSITLTTQLIEVLRQSEKHQLTELQSLALLQFHFYSKNIGMH